MTRQELFVKYHWKQAIILGVLTITVIGLQTTAEEIRLNNNKDNRTGKVLGITTQRMAPVVLNKTRRGILQYQYSIKKIINNYLKQRATFTKPHKNWLFLIDQTKHKLMSLTTPDVYKDLQIKIIILLAAEKKAVRQSTSPNIENINTQWNQLLKQFFWLN